MPEFGTKEHHFQDSKMLLYIAVSARAVEAC